MRVLSGLRSLLLVALMMAYVVGSLTSVALAAPGVITTVAGNGTFGSAGDGGAATAAQLQQCKSVAVDSAGNLFIADSNNDRIRKVSTSGVITTVAGNGTEGFAGDGGVATAAQLDCPYGVAVDSAGNLFIADAFNNRIRKVGAPSSSNNAPALADATFAATKGTPFSRQLVGTDADHDALTYKVTAGTLPVGLNLSASGLIAGTPTKVESQVVTVQVADGKGGTGTGRFVFEVRDGYVKSYVGQGVILIRGTWNASTFGAPGEKAGQGGILYQRLKDMGYDASQILVLDMSDSKVYRLKAGQESVTTSVRQIREKILAWKTAKWGADASVQVDIIAHSAGGLAARQFVKISNVRNGKPLVDVRNVITLGTPLGGITTVEAALADTGFIPNPLGALFNNSVFGDMRFSRAVGNPNYEDVRGVEYWELGGNTPINPHSGFPFLKEQDIPFIYRIGGAEFDEYDGLVNVRSVRGLVPGDEYEADIPTNIPNYRILKLNHSSLVKDPKIVDPCILAILRGEGLDGCGTETGNPIQTSGAIASAAATAPAGQSQLVKVEAADLTGQTQKVIDVPIDAPGEATFSFVARSSFRFTLTSPNGTTYTPDADTAGATYSNPN